MSTGRYKVVLPDQPKGRYFNVELNFSPSPYYDFSNFSNMTATVYTSFSNPFFYGSRLTAMLHFLKAHFAKIIIITPGLLYRHNYTSIEHASEDVTTQLALNLEEKYINEVLSLNQDILSSPKFEQIKWHDYFYLPEYQTRLQEIQEFYDSHKTFKAELDQIAMLFVHKRFITSSPKNCPKTQNFIDRAVASSIQFLLEEIAFFAYSVECGHPLKIYPGKTIPLLTHIHEHYPDAPEMLKRVAFSSISIHKCGSAKHKAVTS